MPDRAALATGASSGIGLAIARLLAEEGYGLTVAARRPEKPAEAAASLRPAFVDTPMTEFVKQHVPAEEMIRTADIAEALRFLLRTSPHCVVPEIVFERRGEAL